VLSPASRNMVVMSRGQLYDVEVFDAAGDLAFSEAALAATLRAIRQHSMGLSDQACAEAAVGLLTSEHRDRPKAPSSPSRPRTRPPPQEALTGRSVISRPLLSPIRGRAPPVTARAAARRRGGARAQVGGPPGGARGAERGERGGTAARGRRGADSEPRRHCARDARADGCRGAARHLARAPAQGCGRHRGGADRDVHQPVVRQVPSGHRVPERRRGDQLRALGRRRPHRPPLLLRRTPAPPAPCASGVRPSRWGARRGPRVQVFTQTILNFAESIRGGFQARASAGAQKSGGGAARSGAIADAISELPFAHLEASTTATPSSTARPRAAPAGPRSAKGPPRAAPGAPDGAGRRRAGSGRCRRACGARSFRRRRCSPTWSRSWISRRAPNLPASPRARAGA